MTQTNPDDLLLAIKALARVQEVIAEWSHPDSIMTNRQFIDEVMAAADDKKVVRAMAGLKDQAAFLDSFDAQVKTLDESDRG